MCTSASVQAYTFRPQDLEEVQQKNKRYTSASEDVSQAADGERHLFIGNRKTFHS